MDDLVYNNATIDYLDQMPADHPYVEKYRHCDIVLCCGQGDWEQEAQQDTRRTVSYTHLDVYKRQVIDHGKYNVFYQSLGSNMKPDVAVYRKGAAR